MTTIYCFSGSGHSLTVASVLSDILACKISEIGFVSQQIPGDDVAIVVFPVYCQSIPAPVKRFLKDLRAENIVLIATYGKISYGNALYEAQKLVDGKIIAGAYIPIGHTFLNGDFVFDKHYLLSIADRVKAPHAIRIPKTRKNPLSNLFPALRSRIGVKLTKTVNCNNCGICEASCPMGAIQNGRIHRACIRCLHCVTVCPQKALQFKNRWILKHYLRHYCKEEYVLYL